ncbi:hypothetical protein Tco_0114740, partial [Tanacetum coccineum]
STDSKVGVGSLMSKASAPPLPAGSLYMEEVHVKVVPTNAFTPYKVDCLSEIMA